MSVNDRGNIKWSSIMMPEHIEMLNNIWDEQDRKQKPIIDEQQQEDINLKLHMAVKNDLTVELKYFMNYDYYNAKGKITSIDRQNKYIKVAGQYLSIESIIDVWID
ncbi:YolD-like family protein [Virgibacillus salarius]|uniref:YolD-like family protein n=1 Tax=Virgibacillus salarius TaxID=447199 RepID=UPI00248F9FD5|nr:YolD-like family protein [Virgibacillus salarius]WBX81272.1 YolD-like family protein [Virgibacillus salarius]